MKVTRLHMTSLVRWLDVLFLAGVGTTLMLLFDVEIRAAQQGASRAFERIPGWSAVLLAVLGVSLLASFLGRVHALRWEHWRPRQLAAYPPAALAAVVAWIVYSASTPPVQHFVLWGDLIVGQVLVWVSALMVTGLAAFGTMRVATMLHASNEPPPSEEPSESGSAISTPEQDKLGRKDAVSLLVKSVCTPGSTVVVLGEHGAGKTSLIGLAQYHIRAAGMALDLEFLDTWGLSEVKVGREVVSAVVKAASKHVDCAAFATLPTAYVDALEDVGWPAKALIAAGSQHESFSKRLGRLDRVLSASGRRIVVVLEDLDRTDKWARIRAELGGLIDAVRQCESIGIVVTMSQLSLSDRTSDYAVRVFSREILVPHLRPEFVEQVFGDLVRELEGAYDDVTLDEGDADGFLVSGLTRGESAGEEEHWGNTGWVTSALVARVATNRVQAAARMIRTPRELNRCVRMLRELWKTNHGEVSLRDSLLAYALRTCDPPAFEFLRENRLPSVLESTTNPHDGGSVQKATWRLLEDKWAASRDAMFRPQESKRALMYLMPRWREPGLVSSYSPRQRIWQDRYWQTFLCEPAEKGVVKDQDVLRAVRSDVDEEIASRLATEETFVLRASELEVKFEGDRGWRVIREWLRVVDSNFCGHHFLHSAVVVGADRQPRGWFREAVKTAAQRGAAHLAVVMRTFAHDGVSLPMRRVPAERTKTGVGALREYYEAHPGALQNHLETGPIYWLGEVIRLEGVEASALGADATWLVVRILEEAERGSPEAARELVYLFSERSLDEGGEYVDSSRKWMAVLRGELVRGLVPHHVARLLSALDAWRPDRSEALAGDERWLELVGARAAVLVGLANLLAE